MEDTTKEKIKNLIKQKQEELQSLINIQIKANNPEDTTKCVLRFNVTFKN